MTDLGLIGPIYLAIAGLFVMILSSMLADAVKQDRELSFSIEALRARYGNAMVCAGLAAFTFGAAMLWPALLIAGFARAFGRLKP